MKLDVEKRKVSDEINTPAKKKKISSEEDKFTAKYFRNNLNSSGSNGLDSLRKFVSICTDTKSELADDYLLAGGSVLEILRLLDTNEKKNLNNVTTVFSALHIVIMKILQEYPQYQSRAEEACRHFINSHLSSVHSMLSNQSNAKQRKIVLRLLASMVSIGGNIPRELLAHLSFHQETLDLLSQQTKPTDPQSVRTCFIHFVLSFLIDTSVPIIKTLLDKRGMLSSIFPDLIYDSHETVHLVLSTVKKYVLEQPGITKTSKLHVFSTPVLQSLVSLYNWKGPRNWPGFKNKNKGTIDDVNQEDKAIAVDALHEFLLVLLTSSKHGVIFNDKSLGTSGKKNNQLVNTILQSLDRPWEHEKPCELVSKILAACPDLIRSQLTYTEPFLEPRVSKKWRLVMKFVRSIVVNIDPDILKPSLTELSLSQLISATLTLGMPLVVLKSAVMPSVNAASIFLRHEAVLTLVVMLRKIKDLLDVAEKNLTVSSDFFQYKSAIKEYILKNMPNVGGILKAWSQAGEPEEANQETIDLTPSKTLHYASILDLLDAYHQVCPEFLDVGLISDPQLEPKILLNFTEGDDDQLNELELIKMKLQAVKIILLLDSTAFELQEKLFSEIILFLVSILNHESIEIHCEANKIMKMLLGSSELFEGCNEQMDIWLNCFGMFEAVERDTIANWLVKIIKTTTKRKDKYFNMIIDAEEKSGDQIVSTNKIKDIFNELMDKDPSTGTIKISKMQGTTSIPTILCSALDNLRKKPDENIFKYMSFVTIFTLHCQVAPGALINLCEHAEGLPVDYLNSWKSDVAPVAVDQPLAKNNVLKFSKILMTKEEINFSKIFEETGRVKTKQEVLDLFRMTVFYLIHFIQRGKVTPDDFNRYKLIILFLLDYSKKMEVEEGLSIVLECSQLILKHPLILQNFSPVPKIASELEVTITHGLVDIFQKITDVNDKNVLPELFGPFKSKLIAQLRTAINKTVAGGRRLMKSRCLLELVGIFQLEEEEIFDLLKGILSLYKETFVTKEKNALSVMGQLIGKLVELLADKKIIDPTKEINLIHKVCIHLSQLKVNSEIDFSIWELALLKFFNNYPSSITKIDAKIFTNLLENKINSSTVEFISFLTGKNEKLISVFVEFSQGNESVMKNSELIFSVLASNIKHKWDKSFLKNVYKTYRSSIKNYFLCLEQAQDWIQKNPETIGFLIKKCFKLETCKEISQIILSSGDKLETVDSTYVKLLQNLYEKYFKLGENPEEILTTLLQILIKISVSTLKKDAKNEEKLEVISHNLCRTIDLLKSSNKNYTFEDLNQHHLWPQFTRFSLKLGLKISKNEKKHLPLLKTLSKVCDIAYKDKTETEYVKTLFEMTTSHSEFVNLMLSNQKIKTDLLELLYILVRKNNSTMGSIQLPLYLSAYSGTLSESDQWIVKILQHYEAENIKFNDYQPYLFGEAAASHYSVKGGADTALWRQPSTSQVLELFNIETVKKTVKNYPVKRGLKVDDILEESDVYDPAFYLPLFNHLLGDSNVVACHKVTQTGALALAFAACGSEDSDVRMAAFTVITKFYHHLEGTSSKEKCIWIRLIDSMRNAISSLDCGLEKVRLSCLVTNFFAKSSMILTLPSHPLYAALNKFFMAKAAVELDCIPEFLTLFHSSDIQYKIHRHWILEVIRDGMKTEVDMEVALNKCALFKIIFSFYYSILAGPETKNLILQVIAASVKIPKAALMLTRGYGLQVWLDEAEKNLNPRDLESKKLISNINALIA